MSRVPKELDALMWTLAEEDSPAASDEFLQRYPLYREELLKRRQTVSGLRKSRGRSTPRTAATPRFEHRQAKNLGPAPRQVAVVSVLVLAALAMASYTVTLLMTPARPSDLPAPVRQVPTGPVELPSEPVVTVPPTKNPPPTNPPAIRVQGNPSDPPVVDRTPKYLKPQQLAAKQAPLHAILQMLANQSAVGIELAPGLANPTIDVDYHDLNTIEILKDLGTRYQFTAFDQGDGTIVIYPAVDANQGKGTMPERRVGG